MISVGRLLNNLHSYNVNLIAGKEGVQNIIEYLSIQESPLKSERIRKNGLIMSTLQSFLNTKEVIDHIKWLISIEIKAIAIHLVIIKKVPQEIIDFCNTNSLPLMTIPENVPYSDFFSVYNQLLQEDSDKTRSEIELINTNLLKAVASGKGPETILKTMSEQLASTIVFIDKWENIKYVQSTSQYNNWDIEGSVEHTVLRDSDFIKSNFSEDIAVNYTLDINNMMIPFNLFPIISENEYYGSILIEMKPTSSLLFKMIIKYGKTALLLDLARKQTLEKYLKNDDMKYLESLFKPAKTVEKKDYHELSPLIKGENIIYVFTLENFKELNLAYDFLYNDRQEGSLIWIFNQEIIYISSFLLKQNIMDELLNQFTSIIAGISEKSFNPTVEEIIKKYRQAKVSNERGKVRGIKINEWRKMRFDRTLFISTQSQLLVDESIQILSPIIEHDKKYQTDLLNTLEVYLDNFFSLKICAEQLFIHRNTVRFRINKIESLYPDIPFNLKDSETYLVLSNSIKLYKLSHFHAIFDK